VLGSGRRREARVRVDVGRFKGLVGESLTKIDTRTLANASHMTRAEQVRAMKEATN
jgi:hypothetical protein